MSKNFVIAGGGTGGHVYPGVAIAHAAKEIDSEITIHFVGTARGIENKVVPREGFQLHLISIGQLHRSVGRVKQIKTLLLLPWSLIQCLFLCLKLRPIAVLGVGGYASGPFMLVASLLGFKTATWEPNAMPGMANRILSRFVRRSYVVFDGAMKFLKGSDIRKCGIPVRFEGVSRKTARDKFRILIFGGSQGAKAINDVVLAMVGESPEWISDVQIIHQTGSKDFERIQNGYSSIDWVEAHEFLYEMKDQYEKADLVICRGGASTVAELMACGKAAIIIPLPTAADNHQLKNAQELESKSAAILLEQKDLTVESLEEKIRELVSNPNQIEEIGRNAQGLHVEGAAKKLAQDLLD